MAERDDLPRESEKRVDPGVPVPGPDGHPTRFVLARYLGRVHEDEEQLRESLLTLANRHERDPEVRDRLVEFAEWTRQQLTALAPFVKRYGREASEDSLRVRSALFHGLRVGPLGLLRDLQDLALLFQERQIGWTALHEAAPGLGDLQLQSLAGGALGQANRELDWLRTRIKHVARQALTVPGSARHELRAALPKTLTPAAVFEITWAPLAGGLLTLLVGIAALAAGRPWLLPALGPSAFLYAVMPAHPSSRFYNSVVGHFVGLGAGFLAVALFGATWAPGILTGQLPAARVWASALALFLTLLLMLPLRAFHPPAGATALLVTLGLLRTRGDALDLGVGVVLMAALGIAARRMRIRGAMPRTV